MPLKKVDTSAATVPKRSMLVSTELSDIVEEDQTECNSCKPDSRTEGSPETGKGEMCTIEKCAPTKYSRSTAARKEPSLSTKFPEAKRKAATHLGKGEDASAAGT